MSNTDDVHVKASGKPEATDLAAPAAKAAPKPTPAVAARPATKDQPKPHINKPRRRFIWTSTGAFLAANFLMFLRFFFPRTLFEPSTVFDLGYPSDFQLGVDERFKQMARIWVVREADRIFVIYARCTHLGCTPDWKPSENKFKCPCHGSGYKPSGINFEGPTPRPLERFRIAIEDGIVVVDKSKKFQYELGQWDTAGSFLTV